MKTDGKNLSSAGGGLTESLRAKSHRRREGLRQSIDAEIPLVARNDLLPALQMETLPIGEIREPSRRLRKHDPAHVREIAASISAFGVCQPVLIDGENNIVNGLSTLAAARASGLDRVPCIRIYHLSKAELRLLRLAINRLGEKGQWDLDELKAEFKDLVLLDAHIELSGFTLDEIDHISLDDQTDGRERGPLEPEGDALAVTRLGDHWKVGSHSVICGDAILADVFNKLMGGDKARLILTDPPYNVPIAGHVTKGAHREFIRASGELSDEEFLEFLVAYLEAALAHLLDGGLAGIFIDFRGQHILQTAAARHDLALLNLVVWSKTNAGMGSLYRSQHELMPLFKKGREPHTNNVNLGRRGRSRSNVWVYPGASSFGSDARRGLREHPTVKPTAMLKDALLDLTNRGDIVLDPFLGSGSTLIAAEETGRVCRGVELDPLYVDVIVRRYEALTGAVAVLSDTGEAFKDVAARRGREAASSDAG